MTNHVWQSTIFCVCVAVLAFGFRKSRAQVRFWLWLSASLKFLVPFSLLLSLGSRLAPGPVAMKTVASPGAAVVMLQVSEPFTERVVSARSAEADRNWIADGIFGIWLCGFAAVAVVRLRRYSRIRAAVHSSCVLDLSLPVPVRATPAMLEPGVFGLWRPILLFPEDIMQRLTPAQFEGVVAHELCHIRRRDNLTASVHMVVEALFWFHPLVWWIGARLVEERERACDEAVLSLAGEPFDYAEGILSVCRSYLESPSRSFAGVTGSDLSKRIHEILSGQVAADLTLGRKAILAFVAMLAVCAPFIIGVIDAPLIRAQSGPRPQFEVASVKRCIDDDIAPGGRGGMGPSFSPGRMTLNCITVQGLIDAAYVMYANGRNFDRMKQPLIPIGGGPGWIDSERFTINAKAEDKATAYVMEGPLLQTLLEKRFNLKLHLETREIPVYNLVVAKGGPKLRPFQEGSCTPVPPIDMTKGIEPWPSLPAGQRYCLVGGGARGPNFSMEAQGMSLDEFANFLSSGPRPVVNKTGIKGEFEFKFEFGLDDAGRQRLTELTGNDPGEPTMPPVFTAIQEQPGLKLQSAKGKGEFLVIDHVERPGEN
jgi:bla regulator protein blaR1